MQIIKIWPNFWANLLPILSSPICFHRLCNQSKTSTERNGSNLGPRPPTQKMTPAPAFLGRVRNVRFSVKYYIFTKINVFFWCKDTVLLKQHAHLSLIQTCGGCQVRSLPAAGRKRRSPTGSWWWTSTLLFLLELGTNFGSFGRCKCQFSPLVYSNLLAR